jgi:hypothetical protein
MERDGAQAGAHDATNTLVEVQALARPEHILEIDAVAVTGEAHVR